MLLFSLADMQQEHKVHYPSQKFHVNAHIQIFGHGLGLFCIRNDVQKIDD
jgi:hypothetical protein